MMSKADNTDTLALSLEAFLSGWCGANLRRYNSAEQAEIITVAMARALRTKPLAGAALGLALAETAGPRLSALLIDAASAYPPKGLTPG